MSFKRIARVPVCVRRPDPNRTGCTATAIRRYRYLCDLQPVLLPNLIYMLIWLMNMLCLYYKVIELKIH